MLVLIFDLNEQAKEHASAAFTGSKPSVDRWHPRHYCYRCNKYCSAVHCRPGIHLRRPELTMTLFFKRNANIYLRSSALRIVHKHAHLVLRRVLEFLPPCPKPLPPYQAMSIDTSLAKSWLNHNRPSFTVVGPWLSFLNRELSYLPFLTLQRRRTSSCISKTNGN